MATPERAKHLKKLWRERGFKQALRDCPYPAWRVPDMPKLSLDELLEQPMEDADTVPTITVVDFTIERWGYPSGQRCARAVAEGVVVEEDFW